ncbi:unnamed protein product [Rhizophagus irregularis]|nr:unnamed protein product [Rhizophagus irregularis]
MIHYCQMTKLQILFSSALETFNESRSPLQQLNSNDLNELNDDQQNQEINGNDETIKKFSMGMFFRIVILHSM